MEEGVRVGLGSDVAGGHTLSILRAIADAVQVSKLRWRLVEGGAGPLTLPEAFWLATAGGGAFFGQVGRFEPGWAFDAVVLEDSAYPHPQPLSSLERLERLCYLCSDDRRAVVRKFVEGRPAAGAAPRNPYNRMGGASQIWGGPASVLWDQIFRASRRNPRASRCRG